MAHLLNLAPSPAALIESLRDIGYSMDTALADVIDNSITACANSVWIEFDWNAGTPWVAIVDNGKGMNANELKAAMRFGCISPLQERSPEDLGRFGLGMKTASFSQCQHLTVFSKCNQSASCCEWNLESLRVSNDDLWMLQVHDKDPLLACDLLPILNDRYLSSSNSGTIVLWRNLDRLDKRDANLKQEVVFGEILDHAKRHLELVFHRFLSPDPGGLKIDVWMNANKLQAFNPFNPSHPATQELPEQIFKIDGETISVQPYVLPHNNKTSPKGYRQYQGEGGYLHNQGFYIYRNKRLIINGTWFRLLKKAELTKLLRVRVDIPNSLDHLWSIDVRKSHACPPSRIRERLKQIISRIECHGKRVYEQRGSKLQSSVDFPLWERRASESSLSYEINHSHPLIQQLLGDLSSEHHPHFKDLLAALENCLPISLLYNDVANHPEQVQPPELSHVQIENLLNRYIAFLWSDQELPEDCLHQLLSTEPFASHKEETKQVLTEWGWPNEK